MLLMGQPKFQAKGNESAVNTKFYPNINLNINGLSLKYQIDYAYVT